MASVTYTLSAEATWARAAWAQNGGLASQKLLAGQNDIPEDSIVLIQRDGRYIALETLAGTHIAGPFCPDEQWPQYRDAIAAALGFVTTAEALKEKEHGQE